MLLLCAFCTPIARISKSELTLRLGVAQLFRTVLDFSDSSKVYNFVNTRSGKKNSQNGWEDFHHMMEDDPSGPVEAHNVGGLGAGGKSDQKKRLIKIWETANRRLERSDEDIPELLMLTREQVSNFHCTCSDSKEKWVQKVKESAILNTVEKEVGLQPASFGRSTATSRVAGGSREQHSLNLTVGGPPGAASVLALLDDSDVDDDSEQLTNNKHASP
jgi:hypothetical protein